MSSMHPYQIRGTLFMLEKEQVLSDSPESDTGGLLCDESGLGKIRQLLALCLATYDADASPNMYSKATLVVCDPGSFNVWKNEWETLKKSARKKLPLTILHDSTEKYRYTKQKSLSPEDKEQLADYAIVIATFDACKPGSKYGPALQGVSWRRVILSNPSKAKGLATETAKALRLLVACSRWVSTATSIENGFLNLKSFLSFVRSPHADAGLLKTKKYAPISTDDKQWLRDSILRRTKRMVKTDLVSALPKIREFEFVHELTKKEKVEAKEDSRQCGLVNRLKALQVVQGTEFHDPGDSSRLKELVNLLKLLYHSCSADQRRFRPESGLIKIVIASGSCDALDLISLRLDDLQSRSKSGKYAYGRIDGNTALKKRQEVEDAFRAGEIKVLLVTYKTPGGLSSQSANVVIKYGRCYNPAEEQKAVNCVHRMGSEFKKLFVYNFCLSRGELYVADRQQDIRGGKKEFSDGVYAALERRERISGRQREHRA
ncbi:SNF2 family N-terminal domain-containing protein [Geranomyces variabilis]|nr:SNF2 family N-terminal domain-containing protein [Geranomyces variabilis]